MAVMVRHVQGFKPRIGVIAVAGGATNISMLKSALSIDARPLFWDKSGLYASAPNGLVKCNLSGHRCKILYPLEDSKTIIGGTSVNNRYALLIIQDRGLDPFETRGKEIYKIDLLKNIDDVKLTLPENVYVSDIDWLTYIKGGQFMLGVNSRT